MRKTWLWLVLVVLAVLAVVAVGCGFDASNLEPSKPTVKDVQQSKLAPEKKASASVNAMTLEEKVGQLLMVGMPSLALDQAQQQWLTQHHIGNVILFDWNMNNPKQVKDLTTQLQAYSQQVNHLPMLIAVDEEGGYVRRMADYMPAMDSAAMVSSKGLDVAQTQAKANGKALQDLGINLNLAPVLDGDLGDARSYDLPTATRADWGKALGKTYTDEKVLFAYKHFPGIDGGYYNRAGQLVIDKDAKDLMEQDMNAFINAIQGSQLNTYVVVASRALYPVLDAQRGAQESPVILTNLLRKQVGYRGVIMTDDLDLVYDETGEPVGTMAVNAIRAGADIVVVCHNRQHMEEAYNAIINAVKQGTITQEQLDTAVKRVIALKQHLGK